MILTGVTAINGCPRCKVAILSSYTDDENISKGIQNPGDIAHMPEELDTINWCT